MSQDNTVTCYEGIQRIYRNAIVRHLRSSLQQSFPTDYLEQLRSPFTADEWSKIKQNAYASRNTGELSNQVIDEFDLLSVNHFFNLFDKYYDVLLTSNSSDEPREKKRQKDKLLNWSKTIKDLRDPLSHPSEEDFTREDTFLVLDCARRILLRLNLVDDAFRIKNLMDKLMGPVTSLDMQREPLEDRLPPRESIVVDFIGRDKELKELREWFDDPVSRRWALAGEGGKGKSAIAYSFAFEIKLRSPQPFQTVFYLSAKRRKYQEGVIVSIDKPDFCDLDSAFNCLLTCYGWIEEISNPIESKRKRVIELLTEFPALIVVDDIDSLESENENVIEFFSLELPQTKSKVLFTSRRTIFGMGGATTHVGSFDYQDGEKFILSRCQLMELDPSIFNKGIIKEIIRVSEGSPLYIEDLMRLAAMMPAKEAIKIWEQKGGNEARRYTLGRECDLLTADARRVLIGTCIYLGAVSFAEIETVLGITPEILTSALQELQKLFLVPKPRLIEGEQRFEVNVNTRALVRDVYGSTDLYRRIEAAHKTITEGVSKTGRGDIAAIIRQSVFQVKASKHQEAERLLLKALEKYHSDPEIMAFLGWVYKTWHPPRITDAREFFIRAWQLKHKNQEMYEHWCKMEIKELEWTKAAEAAEKGLKLIPNNKLLLYLAGYTRNRLGKDLLGGLHKTKAQKELSEARNYLEKALKVNLDQGHRDEALNSDIYRALALTCELSKDIKSMEYYFKRWLKDHPDDPDALSEWERVAKIYKLSESTV